MFDRLTNRLLDAGAVPAGHGSKLARVLASSDAADDPAAAATPADSARRAVSEHLAELITWDRAVRADAWDSVHQMRVTTRKIRSLLQSSEGSFDLEGREWVLDELRELAAVLGVARDAEVLAERYTRALDLLPEANVRGPVRERLVEGAEKRYRTGWKRSLTAMRSPRYFRLLDALEELVAEDSARSGRDGGPAELTIDSAYKRVRKAAKAARSRHRPTATPIPTRRCTGSANAPSSCATPLRRPGRARWPTGPRRSSRCWATTRTAWSAGRI